MSRLGVRSAGEPRRGTRCRLGGMQHKDLLSDLDRRKFVLGAVSGALATAGLAPACTPGDDGGEAVATSDPAASPNGEESQESKRFDISLAQWSLHRSHFGTVDWSRFGELLMSDPDSLLQGPLNPLDFAAKARELGIGAVEYVNTFFFTKAEDGAYLAQLNKRARDEGVENLLIMCDAEGALGDPDPAARSKAVKNHQKWLRAAATLGCHSIRVNAESRGSYEEQQKLAADGLRSLCELAEEYDQNVLVENHGGLSSNGSWLLGVMEQVDHPRVGTLPDFGNFKIEGEGEDAVWYDRYQGVGELMPYAKAVSAKSYEFDAEGNEVRTDFARMMEIVLSAGYTGYVGIEYEGASLPEEEGISKTRELLERLQVARA